jgi:hypothetical protein
MQKKIPSSFLLQFAIKTNIFCLQQDDEIFLALKKD